MSILLSLIIMYLFIKASSVDSVFLTSYFSGNINCTIIITTEAIYIHVHLHVYIPLLQCLIHRKDSSTRILQSSKSIYTRVTVPVLSNIIYLIYDYCMCVVSCICLTVSNCHLFMLECLDKKTLNLHTLFCIYWK